MRPLREAYLSDIHFPFHDPKAWELTLRVVSAVNPDVVFLSGDIVDFYAVSSFLRDPKRVLQLQDELDVAVKELRRLRAAAPNAVFHFRPGNHEHRMDKFKWKAPELSSLRSLTLPEQLELKALDCSYIPAREPWRLGELWHFHGDEWLGGSINPARSLYLKVNDSMIVGHYHRSNRYIQRTPFGTKKVICNPCLCGLDPEYTSLPNWQQGLTIIDYSAAGTAHDQSVIYYKEKSRLLARVDGKVIG